MNLQTTLNYGITLLVVLITILMASASSAENEGISGIQQPVLTPLKDLSSDNDSNEFPQSSPTHRKTNDPISHFGHGQFIDRDGKPFQPDPESIKEVQAYYLTKLNKEIDSSNDERLIEGISKKEALIYDSLEDKVLANALFLDVLLEASRAKEKAHLAAVNSGLRRVYINEFEKEDFKLDKGVFSKGIRPDIAEILENAGIIVFLKTNAAGDEYIAECRDAGVPIPPPMYEKPWENRGIFDNEFISDTTVDPASGMNVDVDAELWFYESDAPEGACLALPRYSKADPNRAMLLGVICLGKETSKACFWDNPNGTRFQRGMPISIDQFVGGADLDTNGQGTCTACHAGENPFVVHPDKAPFSGLSSKLQPNDWHDPLVHPSWPENPGPTTLLDTVSSKQRCDSCHFQGFAGRFPDVSDPAISQYCSAVLETSVFGGVKRTMPQGGGGIGDYFNHIDALLSACFGDDVVTDPIPDDESFISPPIVIDPLYACATQLAVRGTLLDATVTIYINGSSVASKTSRSPSELSFDVPTLQVGDVVTSVQEYNGLVSDPSDPVTVRDHKADYPAGLPAPNIDPTTIYECGNTVAVRHVPGAKLTVFVNDTDPRSRNTSTGWSGIFPGKFPFDLGDKFTAGIELCDDSSPLSDIETAITSPGTINAPTFDPPEIYPGQELVNIESIIHGAWVEVGEVSVGGLGKFSTPVSWWRELDVATTLGRTLMGGDQMYAVQTLCESSPPIETPPVRDCEDIPAPKIRIPLAGEDYVIVTESIPGARIQVYDSSNVELGDSSGSVIALNRTLTESENITVTQSIGECKGKLGYTVTVRKIEREDKRDKQ